MQILVYGAGNIGSPCAAKLKESGNDVTILARGPRLQEIHEHGIVLQEFHRGQKTKPQALAPTLPSDSRFCSESRTVKT